MRGREQQGAEPRGGAAELPDLLAAHCPIRVLLLDHLRQPLGADSARVLVVVVARFGHGVDQLLLGRADGLRSPRPHGGGEGLVRLVLLVLLIGVAAPDCAKGLVCADARRESARTAVQGWGWWMQQCWDGGGGRTSGGGEQVPLTDGPQGRSDLLAAEVPLRMQ